MPEAAPMPRTAPAGAADNCCPPAALPDASPSPKERNCSLPQNTQSLQRSRSAVSRPLLLRRLQIAIEALTHSRHDSSSEFPHLTVPVPSNSRVQRL